MNLRHILAATVLMPAAVLAQNDTLSHQLDNVVVTSTRNAVSIRHLPTTVSVVDRVALTAAYRPSMLPTLSEEVPGLFVTSRGIMGYGVSDGAAGGISVRGMSSSQGRFLVLIDGQPQYMGLFGHAIADACQTMLAERVEVLRGPASVLYGSNAMGGVMNIITRKMPANGMSTEINIGAGSYGTLQSGLSNRIRAGRFASALALRYDRTTGTARTWVSSNMAATLNWTIDLPRTGRLRPTPTSLISTLRTREPCSLPCSMPANG